MTENVSAIMRILLMNYKVLIHTVCGFIPTPGSHHWCGRLTVAGEQTLCSVACLAAAWPHLHFISWVWSFREEMGRASVIYLGLNPQNTKYSNTRKKACKTRQCKST